MSKVLQDLANLANNIREKETDPEDRKDMEEFITKEIECFPKYFEAVVMMNTRLTIMSQLYDREDYIDKVQHMDQARRDAHIMVAQAINKINRLCDMYEIDHIFKFPGRGNEELQPIPKVAGHPKFEREAEADRELAADAVFGFCKEVFLEGKDLEKYNMHEGYTRAQRDQELYEIGNGDGGFNTKITVDELIDKAREECAMDSSMNSLGMESRSSNDPERD